MTPRRARPEDAAALADIHASAFPAGQAWRADTMGRLLELPGVLGLLAGTDAMLLLRQAADEAEVLTIAVRPQARRQGLARALLEAGMRLLAAGGARALLLEVDEANQGALGLYAALGFADAGRRRDYYAPGQHARLLRREISG